MKTNEEQGAERATISERIKEWNALTDEEREARRSRSVCCPEGHPEVWNPQDPIQEWAWCVRAYKVYDANGLPSSYCRACARIHHDEQRTGRWFNDNGWLN